MNPQIPQFVVVGHVNKGKSSIVACLTENAGVPIDRTPGTTARSAVYSLRAEDRELLRVIDTPGFQEAPAALAWLQSRAQDASQRLQAVRAFVEHFDGRDDFVDEVELLRPLTEGQAGVLYVVDASRPYRPVHEAEMEILRWAGQPGIALLNSIGDEDHSESWQAVLLQFFHAVHRFDAHYAGPEARRKLLEAFTAIRPDWGPAVQAAVDGLQQQHQSRDDEAVASLAEGLRAMLGHVEKQRVAKEQRQDASKPSSASETELRDRYQAALRKQEANLRRRMTRIYGHPDGFAQAPELALLEEDLFSETSWRVFGLTRQQLTLYAAGWGALLGGGLDLAVGGLSLGTGALLGGLIGGASAWFGGTKFGRAWDSQDSLFLKLFPSETGRFRCFGPVDSPQLAWILLDRAITHARTVRVTSHARSANLQPGIQSGEKRGAAHQLAKAQRDALDRGLRNILQAVRKARPLAEDEAAQWRRALLDALQA